MKLPLAPFAAALVVVSSAFAAPAARAAEEGYASHPALHGDRLVFVSEGDLWTATVPPVGSAEPVIAHRLTSAAGDESWPAISPDGRSIAFSGSYDGNVDVFTMPIDGGAPRRLTYHPEAEVVLGWTPDGKDVLFRSAARNPQGRAELWRVSAAGGGAVRYDFGECSLASIHPDGHRIAFTRWSNEGWSWKRYRGGTAPDVWIGDLAKGSFARLTDTDSNELFPAWVGERVVFLSDRTGTANLWSDAPQGGALEQLTTFAPKTGDPTAIEGYDVRWPSVDAAPGGTRIAFCQAGALALVDVKDRSVRRLGVRLASDRTAARERFASPSPTATELSLSNDGKTVLLGSRGEVLAVPVEAGLPARQLTRSSASREWGVTPAGKDRLALITDASGDQEIALMPSDGSAPPAAIAEQDHEWIFPPVASPDGARLAYGDKTLHLHLLDVATKQRTTVAVSEAGEIRDYRFSPDGRWLAYTLPLPSGYGSVRLYEVATGQTVAVSGPVHDDFSPRWDPAGRYLYFLSRRHLDPVLSDLDFEHAFLGTTGVFAVPLERSTPPPLPAVARAAGFDLEDWAKAPDDDDKGKKGDKGEKPKDGKDAAPKEVKPLAIDREGLPDRAVVLPVEAGEISDLEATWGGVLWTTTPRKGLLSDDARGETALSDGDATLHRRDLWKEEKAESVLAKGIVGYALSGDARTVAWASDGAVRVADADASDGDDAKKVAVADLRLDVDTRAEWRQILGEAWRLQRDFYWCGTYCGLDWAAMRKKYEALLPRVGTRAELNDLIGQMIGELGTSHTYVYGGAVFDPPPAVSVGLLGADLEREGDAVRIRRILPGQPWDDDLASPLSAPHWKVADGTFLLSIDGVALAGGRDPYEALQDKGGKAVRLELADDAAGKGRRTITVTTLKSERGLRYATWVEANRRAVDEASKGTLGYLHIPDMGGEGLVAFSRLFYPQITKKGLVVDIRGNRGGFVSQMIIRRLDRQVWAFMQPRHGVASRYPEKSLYGHMAVLIDQHAGSDGDIFPASFRLRGLGPLIGKRTWGGVVGIRSDKPFVDMGMSTQPEFAWWSVKDGWSVENRGVSPDLEVDDLPSDRAAGKDPQLDAAVAWLQKKLVEDPKELPKPPEFPAK